MNKKRSCFLYILIIILISGCQPTPEDVVVINKGDDTLQQIIKQTPDPSAQPSIYTIPDAWKEDIRNDRNEPFVKVDASIQVQKAEKYPVIEVRPGKFSQEQVDTMISYFSQGEALYNADAPMTKSELEQRIIEEQADLVLAKNGNDDLPSPEEIQVVIDDLKKQYESAPETKETIDSTLKIQADNQQETLYAIFDLGKEKQARISVFNCSSSNYTSMFSFENGNVYTPLRSLYGYNGKGLSMTLEQAKETGQNLLNELGLGDFVLSTIQTGVNRNNINEQGYDLIYTQKLNNIPLLYSRCIMPTNYTIDEKTGDIVNPDTGKAVQFAPNWGSNYIEIDIDDTGITSFCWTDPIEVINTQNENVDLLEFDKIKNIFEQQIKLNYIEINKNDRYIYNVDKIQLGLVPVAEKNKIGYYLLVPAWTFYGYYENPNMPESSDSHLQLMSAENNIQTSLLVINAIEGSIIDTTKGY